MCEWLNRYVSEWDNMIENYERFFLRGFIFNMIFMLSEKKRI